MSVLAWHQISTQRHLTAVSPAQFRAQIDLIISLGLAVVSLQEAGQPGGGVALTFDDGHQDTYTEAFPVLQDRGLTATLYVSTKFVSTSEWFEPGGRAISWSMLRELSAAGWCIGSHAVNHRPLVGLQDLELHDELSRSRRVLEDTLGCPCLHFCAPYGEMDDRVLDAVRSSGYETAALSVPARYRLQDDSHVVYRSGIYGQTPRWVFKFKARGWDQGLRRSALGRLFGVLRQSFSRPAV